MTDWRTHLTPEEAAQMLANKQKRADLHKEDRKIYDRARKRWNRSKTGNQNGNPPPSN